MDYKEKVIALLNSQELSKEQKEKLENIFPELKESEDERVSREITEFFVDFKNGEYKKPNENTIDSWLSWLEKQDYAFEIKEGHWYKCVCDYVLNGSDLMFKNDRLYYCRSNWRLRGEIDERNVKNIGINGYKSFFRPATNQEIKDWLEKQGEKGINGKNREIPFSEQKPVDKIEPKFKVKYAGSEYNVLEVKDIAGVTYYGIEDEPNHIDYVQAENCERVDGYSIKESGSPFPTKPAKFSEQNPVEWSEEDDDNLSWLVEMLLGFDGNDIECYKDKKFIDKCKEVCKWLKAIKDRTSPQPKQEWSDEDENTLVKLTNLIGSQYCWTKEEREKYSSWLNSLRPQKQWKPSDEQMESLKLAIYGEAFGLDELQKLYDQLKAL